MKARSALDAGQPDKALALYNEELEVKSERDLPADSSGDNALLLLDRAVILQELGQFELSSRDLQTADKQVEMLDFSRGTADEIGRYLFSDDVGPYKSPPYEKLMINTINMINYLARGDLNGGKIEARRFAVMQKYLTDNESASAALLGAGSYLAGFIFEQSGEPQTALRYYDEALQYGRFRTLEQAVVRLAGRATYRTPRIQTILQQHGGRAGQGTKRPSPAASSAPREPTAANSDAPEPSADKPATEESSNRSSNERPVASFEEPASSPPVQAPPASQTEEGEILVVISYGRVPAKVAKRVPIGLALTYASGALSPRDHARANELAAQGLVTWVNYPELDKAKGKHGVARYNLDNRPQPLDGVPIEQHTRKAWDEQKGAVIASAITRMISRVVAGKGAQELGGGDSLLGVLLSLFTQATLTAADTPDTRSWATLPARIAIGRVRVAPGDHTVELLARGKVLRKTISIKPGGFVAVALTVLR